MGERYLPWVVRKDPRPSRSARVPGVAGTRAGETVGNEPNPGFPGIPGAGKGFKSGEYLKEMSEILAEPEALIHDLILTPKPDGTNRGEARSGYLSPIDGEVCIRRKQVLASQ